MAYPKHRSATSELLVGHSEGSLEYVGKDWSTNHPDIELPDHAGPCSNACGCPDHVAPLR